MASNGSDKISQGIARIEFCPLVRIGVNRGHYWPEETTDKGPTRINAGARAFFKLIINRYGTYNLC